jgi:thioesterase domain-containing protein
MLDVIRNNDRALRAYQEGSYTGRLTLIRAAEQPAGRPHHLGWDRVVTGGVAVTIAPGDHYTMLQRPHVEALAAQVRVCLDAATG